MPGNAEYRANAFLVLSRAYDLPATWPEEMGQLLRKGFVPWQENLAGLAEAVAAQAECLDRRPRIAQAHSKLFIDPFQILTPPWAAYYLDPQKQLLGRVSQYAAKAYAEAGLGRGKRQTEPPDHVAHELEFMYYLAFYEAQGDDPVWRVRSIRFWNEHLGRWLPRLADSVAENAQEDYYARLAELTLAFSRVIYAELDPQTLNDNMATN
ncbi:TorD/DmsD family molecular chaperone [Halomonas llamarensis]|uniref:Molecular chaperone TorD family protein n=1 Tax=Halomonas llamarensis TaxID=2945104 RepID=A0ABT0SUD5_9GAMM|nr:molecular chaperone TorD family protein [Halomonas llamarensis]MCL7931331.1 molecular chaperone TorD family protein [Halomonas llamarensis]